MIKKITRVNRYLHEELLVDESIFALQNGLIGVRGNFAEGYGIDDYRQTLINGFYNFYDYHYEENSPAFPQKGQRIIHVLDGQLMEFYINGKAINMLTCKLVNLERDFDLEQGITIRKATYETQEGYRFLIIEERILSFVQKELFTIKVTLKSFNYTGKVILVSKLNLPNPKEQIDFDVRINQPREKQMLIEEKGEDDLGVFVVSKTTNSNLKLAVGMSHSQPCSYIENVSGFDTEFEFELKANASYCITKFLVYTPSIIHENVLEKNRQIIKDVTSKDFNYYLDLQRDHLNNFWKKTGLKIIDNNLVDNMIQYNLYQLYSCANNDFRFNIPAKGLTGEGYEGHYFWDTEIYMLPFFTITNPHLAKSLLLYRYHHIMEARMEANNQGSKKGIKIPWRTINGEEASPYFPAGSAQYHINSDVSYAVIKYYEFTGDVEFIVDYGFELILETARFLYSVGNYYDKRFHINGVTGPDEYSAIVNDNYYTNSLAKYHFEYLGKLYYTLKEKLNDKIKDLHLSEKEVNEFNQAAKLMYFEVDSDLGVYAQDDAFFKKAELDINKIPKDKFPLLLHYHPLFLYKHQVLKQPDVLLSMFLLDFKSEETIKRNFDYYLKRTTHDSSLSRCIHSIMAFRLNKLDLAYEYFDEILKMDIENTHKNTHHGIHIANSGGIYLTLVFGILGLRIKPNHLIIRPHFPKNLGGMIWETNYQGTMIQIELKEKIYIKVSKPITLGIYADMVNIVDEYQCDYK